MKFLKKMFGRAQDAMSHYAGSAGRSVNPAHYKSIPPPKLGYEDDFTDMGWKPGMPGENQAAMHLRKEMVPAPSAGSPRMPSYGPMQDVRPRPIDPASLQNNPGALQDYKKRGLQSLFDNAEVGSWGGSSAPTAVTSASAHTELFATKVINMQPRPMGSPNMPGAVARPKVRSVVDPKPNSKPKSSSNTAIGIGSLFQAGVGGGILAGSAAYATGDGSFTSVAAGTMAGAGIGSTVAGVAGRPGAAARGLYNLGRKGSDRLSKDAFYKQLAANSPVTPPSQQAFYATTSNRTRYSMLGSGALLGGATFGYMAGGNNRNNHRRGFNQRRGNTF